MTAKKKVTKKKPRRKAKKKAAARRKPGPPPGEGGRPKANINWVHVVEMARICCTQDEIANAMGVGKTTLERRCESDQGMTFGEFCRRHSLANYAELRKVMWRMALHDKDGPMVRFLATRSLGMTEKLQIGTEEGKPAQVMIVGGQRVEF